MSDIRPTPPPGTDPENPAVPEAPAHADVDPEAVVDELDIDPEAVVDELDPYIELEPVEDELEEGDDDEI